MPEQSLPEGVERYEQHMDHGMLPLPSGRWFNVADLPKIIDQVRQSEHQRLKEALLSKDAADQVADEFTEGEEGIHPEFVASIAEALCRTDAVEALLDTLDPFDSPPESPPALDSLLAELREGARTATVDRNFDRKNGIVWARERVEAALHPSGEQGEETASELALRLADAQAVVQTVYDNADEDQMEDVECAFNGLLGGFFSALDHALRGTQGCLDDNEFAAKRAAALKAHADYLRLSVPATDPSKEVGP